MQKDIQARRATDHTGSPARAWQLSHGAACEEHHPSQGKCPASSKLAHRCPGQSRIGAPNAFYSCPCATTLGTATTCILGATAPPDPGNQAPARLQAMPAKSQHDDGAVCKKRNCLSGCLTEKVSKSLTLCLSVSTKTNKKLMTIPKRSVTTKDSKPNCIPNNAKVKIK